MFRRHKRIIAIVALLVVVMFILGMMIEPLVWSKASSISDLQTRYDQLQTQKKKIQQQIDKNKSQQADASEQIKTIQQKIDADNEEINNLGEQIDQMNSDIALKQQEIDAKQTEIEQNTALYKRRLRVMYETGSLSYIEVLLSSKSFTDFFGRVQTLKVVSEYDTKLLAKLKADKQDVLGRQQDVQKQKDGLQAVQSSMLDDQNDLKDQYDDVNGLLSKLKSDSGTYSAQMNSVQKQIEQTDEQIQDEARKATGGTYVGGAMYWPIQNCQSTITSNFNWRYDPYYKVYSFHVGLDIAKADHNSYGWPIQAANSGKIIVETKSGSGYGNHIEIDHGGGVVTLYGHMSSFAPGLKVGSAVSKGQVIGYVGSTGASTGPHLHFSVLVNGTYVNPLNYTYGNPNCNNLSSYQKGHFGGYISVKP